MYLDCGEMRALSEPPQVYAKAILVNLTDEHEPASLLSAEQVKRNADGSLTVQASDGGLMLNIARNASVTPFGTKNKAKLEDCLLYTSYHPCSAVCGSADHAVRRVRLRQVAAG